MEAIQKEHDKVWASSRKSRTIDQTQSIIEQLQRARSQIAADPTSAQVTLAKLQNPIKTSFDNITATLKETHGGHNKYTRSLDRLFKDKTIPSTETDPFASSSNLINRAIYLHLLREGLFDVASTYHFEAAATAASQRNLTEKMDLDVSMDHPFGQDYQLPVDMEAQFTNMYHILTELKDKHNLHPAIAWSRENSVALEARGSNLEFELCRLQYMDLFLTNSVDGVISEESRMRALLYAQQELQAFRGRYMMELQPLMGAMAFCTNLNTSPYKNQLNNTTAWEEVAHSFTKEFCSLLELSAESPLYIAATAGAIALPQLLKLQAIQKEKRTEWTSANEMPVETPLPPSYHFHSIFVCPVSKEQTTDQNPPMMLPCCHVIAQESLTKLAKGSKFKCPYCPVESHPKDAKRVFL